MSSKLACLILAAVPAVSPAQAPAVTALDLEDGQAILGWISASSFRFCRAWGEQKCAPRTAPVDDEVKVTREDTLSHIRLSTEYVVVEIDRKDGRLRISDTNEKELMAETTPLRREGPAISVERIAAPDEAFYGLGPRTDVRADGRGQIIESTKPFLISSRGYGLYHESPGNYVFDLASTKADRYRVTVRPSQRFEYDFYYGPTPKSILEEHRLVIKPRGVQDFSILSRTGAPRFATLLPAPEAGSWTALADSAHSLVHASLSAVLNPVFDLAPYRRASDLLFRRAVQLASISPLAADTSGEPLDESRGKERERLLELRRRMAPFLLAYVDETGYKGYPIIHPLALQYPNDTEGGKLADEFLVGDEILAAPILTESNRRTVYFPMGNWTELRTNRVYPGRQRAEVESPPDDIPLFVKNGSIVPMESEQASGPMVLHYLPRLAAEFFLYEPDISEYSQLHAAPALDLMRLEIDSKKGRSYEWIIHHQPAAREVKTGETVLLAVKDHKSLRPDTWYYDQDQQNIHIVVQASAGQTRVTHVAF